MCNVEVRGDGLVRFTPCFEEPGAEQLAETNAGQKNNEDTPPIDVAGFDVGPVDGRHDAAVPAVLLLDELVRNGSVFLFRGRHRVLLLLLASRLAVGKRGRRGELARDIFRVQDTGRAALDLDDLVGEVHAEVDAVRDEDHDPLPDERALEELLHNRLGRVVV